MVYPSVAVYAGAGASHSWTWFADLLERVALFDVAFVGEEDVLAGCLSRHDVLLVGGGDTYAVARALGRRGADEVDRFVSLGGFYGGSCAGAYLVLSGVDLDPFTPFSLIRGGMLNVMADPPAPLCMAHKYAAPYGDDTVFNPAYGEVLLAPGPVAAAYPCFNGDGPLAVPLLGGPVIYAGDEREVLARYSGVSRHAAALWPRERAADFIAGNPAVLLCSYGDGTVMANGPHPEHPFFPRGNALVAQALADHLARAPRPSGRPAAKREMARDAGDGPAPAAVLEDIKRQVSNARIVAFGLEKMPVTWTIGVKVWEPEKIRMFLECAWRRLTLLERTARGADTNALERLAWGYRKVDEVVKLVKTKVESGEDSLAEAETLLVTLKELTASFLSLYFRLRLEGTDD